MFLIFAVFTAFLLYGVALEAPLQLDDGGVLDIARAGTVSTRPLGFASFWVSEQAHGLLSAIFPWKEVFYVRFGNILIHALAATALFWLLLELTGETTIAAIAGTLFLVHPIQTQAVTYLSQRFESQAAMFMIASAAAYVRFRKRAARGWLAIAILCAAGALLTKETAVVLPLWLILIECVFFNPRELISRRLVLIAPLAIGLFIPAWRAFRSSGGATLTWIPWSQYLITQGPVLSKYLQLSTWPREQFLFYDFQPVESLSWPLTLE